MHGCPCRTTAASLRPACTTRWTKCRARDRSRSETVNALRPGCKGCTAFLLTFSGARAFRRSHTMTTGEASSSDDVTSLVACKVTVSAGTKPIYRTHVIGMPSDIAHAFPPTGAQGIHPLSCTSVRQSNHLPLVSQIPHNRISRAAGRCENMLHLTIPCQRRYFIELRGTRARRVRLARVLQVPDVDLTCSVSITVHILLRSPTSPLIAPDERRLGWMGLKSRPRTEP